MHTLVLVETKTIQSVVACQAEDKTHLDSSEVLHIKVLMPAQDCVVPWQLRISSLKMIPVEVEPLQISSAMDRL